MRPAFASLLFSLALVPACTQFPELDAAVSPSAQNAEYPELVNVDPIVARTQTAGPSPEATSGALAARVGSLKARAAKLRRGVVDPKTRARMRAGVS